MKDVICFQKLKLTNNTLDQHGHVRGRKRVPANVPLSWTRIIFTSFAYYFVLNYCFSLFFQIILHSMHRYKPRFHVIQSDDVYNTRWGLLQVFSFPETEFTAVTAYQNEKVKMNILHEREHCNL